MLHRNSLLVRAAALLVALTAAARGGFYYNGVSPLNHPWPGGIIPYVIDPALSAAQRQAYLDGVREWELACGIHFVPRSTETDYILFKYNPSGPNSVSGSQPQLVQVNALTRSQICHEMGHSLGLDHEHIRQDRDTRVTVNTANISSGNGFWFDINPTGVMQGVYDFESVMHFSRDLFSVSPGTLDTLTAKPGYERYQPRMGNFALSPGDRAAAAAIFGPPALSPVVTNTNDTGPGSLRAALYHAADHPGTPVTFNLPNSDPGFSGGVFTIKITGHLPPLATNGVTVDATTQPGYAGKPLVFVDGSNVLAESGQPPGLMIYGANCTVKGLGFIRSPWVGVALLLPDATGNTVRDCWCGVDPGGTSAAANTKQGIQISDGAHGNTIGPGNVLSGNTEYGVWISGAGTTDNVITGNRIGTTWTGNAALPNNLGGVIVTGTATGNTIGDGNVISGNTNAGVWITGSGVFGNTVSGNFIGTNAAGNTAVPNSSTGVYLLSGASRNVVSGNVVSGNGAGFGYGIVIANPGTDDNAVSGNLIGLTPGGAPLGNAFAGVAMWDGSTDSVIYQNRIAHNASLGVAMYEATTVGHTLRENSISDHGFNGIGIGPANHALAAPAVGSAVSAAAGITVSGTLASTASSGFRIEFFASDAPGWGAGATFIGAIDNLTTDAGGNASFLTTLPAAVSPGKVITATATSVSNGDSSEFSAPFTVTAVDGDNDGMPDDFENSNGLNAALDDAALDKDHDGWTNLDEYLAGTDPRSAADFFRATSVTRSGNNVIVKFRSSPGRIYQIEGSETLAAGSWTIRVPAAVATSSELTVSLPINNGRSFYRATLLRP
jgi:parallel beta-helix repeat protein